MAPVFPAVLSWTAGYLLVAIAWRDRSRRFAELLLRLSLAAGFGLGIFSLVYFAALVFGLNHLLAEDLILLALLFALFFWRRKTAAPARDPAPFPGNQLPSWVQRLIAVSFTIALVAALYSAILGALAHPHGDGWDAFAIWNLHARFLFRGSSHWHDGFTSLNPWSHPDYPLLLPAAVAHFWTYLGHDDPAVPAALGLVFTFSTVAVLFSALWILRGRTVAMLGGLALLSTPFFVEQGVAQYADVPLAFFFLAAVVLLGLFDSSSQAVSSHPYGLLVLAGFALGFAAWTKNEGMLFLLATVAARLLILIRSQAAGGNALRVQNPGKTDQNRPAFAVLLFALVPAILWIVWFKHSFAPAGELFADPHAALHKLLRPSRYWIILNWYGKEFLRFGGWLLVPGTLLWIGLYLAVRSRSQRDQNPAILSSLIALGLTLAGYFAIYVITPYDLYWHLRFSLNRLFLQLWPCAIFLFCLAIPLSTTPHDVSDAA
jgi:hypothetical protein